MCVHNDRTRKSGCSVWELCWILVSILRGIDCFGVWFMNAFNHDWRSWFRKFTDIKFLSMESYVLVSYERTPMDEAISRGKLDLVDAINAAVLQADLNGVRLSDGNMVSEFWYWIRCPLIIPSYKNRSILNRPKIVVWIACKMKLC